MVHQVLLECPGRSLWTLDVRTEVLRDVSHARRGTPGRSRDGIGSRPCSVVLRRGGDAYGSGSRHRVVRARPDEIVQSACAVGGNVPGSRLVARSSWTCWSRSRDGTVAWDRGLESLTRLRTDGGSEVAATF